MQEKIASFNTELNNIKLVVEKLVTKQNSSVFDKICKMCSDLFDKVCEIDPKNLSKEDIFKIIDILKRLLELCETLKNYKDYLISVVNQNIATLNETKNDTIAAPTEVVSEVEEVNVDEVKSGATLKYVNPDNPRAA